ncbi:DNA mismatch endonuclease Vsr [Antarcticibacterium sp. 1MA-6-2]|uniref:very short patch repair endonuclease n=1 Tax=Antarcticibacterium sp. 1MA-6-2 TaxID=2908210 RepID=UPI001F329C92|nr:DNA mismatch endonuclease Vsr [Antarcticibacterium sp. 1MA-6-2]UJH90931.1 DNA mismatch endonuclease Vsr [Antarcticibacterium sp. 1MA-6-2]
MADVHDKKTRSHNMRQIKGKDTKPELLVRKYLHSKGLRYRLHKKNLPGKPDIIFPRRKIAIFVNGCFWHGHESCKYFQLPKTRTEWWKEKISNTVARDIRKIAELQEKGWHCIVVWECDLKTHKKENTLNNLFEEITLS